MGKTPKQKISDCKTTGHISTLDIKPFEMFIQDLGKFVSNTFLIKDFEKDGAEIKQNGHALGIDYDSAVSLKGMPFVIRYDAARASKLKLHKDNVDLSFILLLSDPDDFEAGGTFIEALNTTIPLAQGQALVFNGQLVHSAAAITKGRRYVLSGFTTFSDDFIQRKRKGTLRTMPYHH